MIMFSKILIANRGEIAVRIIRACREMGIKTVAVYSDADADALHTVLADEKVCIGPAAAKDSYLNSKNIISAAMSTGVQAIHPGYGFLSENHEFAAMCKDFGIVFIGPPASVISKMGNKTTAIALMKEIGVPTVPGSAALKDGESAVREAEKIGFPLLVKAEAGGGGKGIRLVNSRGELIYAVETAAKEAQAAFGNPNVYLEKFLTSVRHIEIQILADEFGNIITLGERDCSLQRNKQKVIEETPSPVISPEIREKMCASARNAAKAAGYVNAGTVEFLLDGSGNYYFIEMNTRLQVEHGITEQMCGIDIVKWQIRIASRMPMNISQSDIKVAGSVIECRINAKSAGKVNFLHIPAGPGVRFDSALYNGCSVQAYYDSMIAKVITEAPTREEALRKIEAALCELIIDGIPTNIKDQLELIRNENFIKNKYDTNFLNGL